MASSAVPAFARFLSGVLALDDEIAGLLRRNEGVPGEFGGLWMRALAGDATAEARLSASSAAGGWSFALGQVRAEIDRAGHPIAPAHGVVPPAWPVTFPVGIRLAAADAVHRIRITRSIRIEHPSQSLPERPSGILLTIEVRGVCNGPPASLLDDLGALDASAGAALARKPIPVVLGLPDEGSGCVLREDLREATEASGGFPDLRVWAFAEDDVRALVSRVLVPAADHYLQVPNPGEALAVFGVDGRGGRPFTFLQAIAVLWQTLLDPDIEAVLRVDGAASTGESPIPEMLRRGVRGRDANGRAVSCGFVASDGAFGSGATAATVADRVFDIELGCRVASAAAAGDVAATGIVAGTVGSLVAALQEYRPFAPAFLGRSAGSMFLAGAPSGVLPRPVYLDGGSARSVSEPTGFAEERVILLSAYARALGRFEEFLATEPLPAASLARLPLTVAWLRTALQSAAAPDPVETAARAARVAAAAAFVGGGGAARRLAVEQRGWSVFYDVLAALGQRIAAGDPYALALQHRARSLVAALRV